MANFVTNSDNTKTVKKDIISHMSIEADDGEYRLIVRTNLFRHSEIVFENDPTLPGIRQKAQTLLTELES